MGHLRDFDSPPSVALEQDGATLGDSEIPGDRVDGCVLIVGLEPGLQRLVPIGNRCTVTDHWFR